MSFFNDIIDFFKIDDISKKITISFVVGVGLIVVGKIKIDSVDENMILLKGKNSSVSIYGNDLVVRSAAKGEVVVSGKIFKIETGGES